MGRRITRGWTRDEQQQRRRSREERNQSQFAPRQ
jgi:hypothetical protein